VGFVVLDSVYINLLKQIHLTATQQKNTDPLAVPIIEAAGTDITHWFDPDTRDPKMFVSPSIELNLLVARKN